MIQGIKEFVRMAKDDPATTLCAIVFGLTSLIVAQPTVISFLPEATALIVVQVSEFIQKASIFVGLVFAAQSKPNDLQKKDVIPEVLTTNQPKGKEELQNPEVKPVVTPAVKPTRAEKF